ncbi:2-phospho-L-lactate guanylyltransferase [Chelatococcus sp. GCM10030263]|uniref:2-phospho-L-lactate guanylyltransferase n=1 Tax=Chelatococcus sp. GCM10030263 TaxID=3273387 RepID=UPI003618CB3A
MMRHPSMGEIWAVVPVKSFARAKTRLAGILAPRERQELAMAMLADVLEALAATEGLDGILVVTADAEAAAMAGSFGALVLTDPVESGTNPAVLWGLRELDRLGKSGAVVVPGDLPFVTPAELGAVLAALSRSPAVLVPAVRDGGTNILALSLPSAMTPAFGHDSFARHLAAATAARLDPAVLTFDGAGHDIDVAADLVVDAGCRGGRRTRACLGHLHAVARSRRASQLEEAV